MYCITARENIPWLTGGRMLQRQSGETVNLEEPAVQRKAISIFIDALKAIYPTKVFESS